ncbi:hypothetical protein, partial [Campylobacter pinnipediorum]|uniref:hypothetical protein n=1 Tax=Campylobacter pinnipediorum TaxID=1965231 RepID=UPI00112F8A67
MTFTPRQLDKLTPSLNNFKDQNNIQHDAGINNDIKANNKNKAMFEYLNLIVSENDNIFKYLISDNANLTSGLAVLPSIENAITQTEHPHLQKIAKILKAAKEAKDAGNNNVDVADIGIGDKFKISIDTTNNPKLLIKDTQDTAGEDTFTLDGTTLKYQRNTTENVSRHILLNFEADGASNKVSEAVGDDGSIGRQKKDADREQARALVREAIDKVFASSSGINSFSNITDNNSARALNALVKEVLLNAQKLNEADNTYFESEKTIGLDGVGNNGKGSAKLILKKNTTNSNIELDVIYDADKSTASAIEQTNASKFVLQNNNVTFMPAVNSSGDIGDDLIKNINFNTLKEKLFANNAGLNKNNGAFKFTLEEITKAKAKAKLYELLKKDLPTLLSKEKIDNLINAGTTGIENEKLKAIVDKVKEAQGDIRAEIILQDNKTITLTIKATGTEIEISDITADKKDTITLTGDKFKITTDSKVAKPVLEELAKSKANLGQEPFKKAIEEAKKLIPKEKGQVLTQDEVNKRQAFLDAVYKNDDDNALKTILAAISNQDLTTANTDEAILSKIGEAGQTTIKTMLEKAKDVVEYVRSLALKAQIGGATVKLEIVDGKPALTIAKDGKTDTFKLSDNNNGQLEYTSAKTSTKDSVLHLLSNFDPANLNATLSVFIAKNGGEITAKEITAGNIDRIEDTADDKERDL